MTADEPDPVRLHVEAHGEGAPPVVLGHGFGGSARNWGPQVRALREGHRVVVFDARGHARSEAPEDPGAYTPEALVADLGRVVEAHAGGGPAVVGGLSMGAGVALRFALAQPEAVRGLVLMAPPPGRDAGGKGRAAATRAPGWARGFADAIERDGLDAAGARYVWGEARGLDAGSAELVRQGFLEHPPHALVHLLRCVLATWPPVEAMDGLEALDVPALVVVGERDTLSRAPADALAERLPDARRVVAPGAGHVVNLAARDLVNDALTDFLAELRS